MSFVSNNMQDLLHTTMTSALPHWHLVRKLCAHLTQRNKISEATVSCWASCDIWQAFLHLVPLTVANASRILSWIENWEFCNKIIKFKVLYWSLLVLTSLNKSSFEKTSSFKIIMCGYNNEESICETMILKAGLFLDASDVKRCLLWHECTVEKIFLNLSVLSHHDVER